MTTLTLAYSFNFPRINWKAYCLGAFLIILCLAVFYVLQVNYMIRGSYLIKDYQKQINSLLQENKILEANFAKTGFMKTISQRTQEMSFEKVKEVKYMQVLDASVFLPKAEKINN